jgi:(R,R)-butanediol dehydrogenase / meso-butanediol dehydrogenase / diacetyl reductase
MSNFKQGDTALVCGAGPIGLGILVALKVWGARIVVVSEFTGSRTARARKFGADLVINPLAKETGVGDVVEEEDPVKAAVANETAAEMVDVAFAAAGHQSALDTAIAATRSGGTILNVAINEKPLQFQLNDLTILKKGSSTACAARTKTGLASLRR